MASYSSIFPLVAIIFTFIVNSQQCTDPQIISTTYTTQDATILKQVAFISNFQVKCKKGEAGNLYASFKDTISPVASVDSGKYQISWTEDIKTAKTGDTLVKVYDESGYIALRKAMRAGEDVSGVGVFARIVVHHRGTYGGPWISCELLAAAFSIAIAYVAVHFRTKLLN
ncbi:unnamed protein product [Phaedon cochleariae]|uniref:Translocon-associated protein subunit delta n=1 Tax=Phaedon cochleariae TaxID=80249 RepID=A0A9P0DDZ5_PHACE|nr:unnamed protein product [Phaedon cochleariae]